MENIGNRNERKYQLDVPRIGNMEIEVFDIKESSGFKIGDILKLKPDANTISPQLARAKKIEVVGADDRENLILQIDGGNVHRSFPEFITAHFDVISS